MCTTKSIRNGSPFFIRPPSFSHPLLAGLSSIIAHSFLSARFATFLLFCFCFIFYLKARDGDALPDSATVHIIFRTRNGWNTIWAAWWPLGWPFNAHTLTHRHTRSRPRWANIRPMVESTAPTTPLGSAPNRKANKKKMYLFSDHVISAITPPAAGACVNFLRALRSRQRVHPTDLITRFVSAKSRDPC